MTQTGNEFEWEGGAEQSICKRVAKNENKFYENDPIAIDFVQWDTVIKKKLNDTDFEPLFFVAFIVDIEGKTRISECFCFDYNTKDGHIELLDKNINR